MRSSSADPGATRAFGSRLIVLACVAFFGLALYASYGMSDPSAYRLPRVVAFAGLAVSILELVVGPSRPREPPAGPGKSEGLAVSASVGFAAAYFTLVPLLGFVLATALAIAGFGALTRFPRPRLVAILAVVVPMVLYLTFGRLLQAPLPTGLLGSLRF